MGKLIKGIWHDVWYDTEKNGGAFKREDSQFSNMIITAEKDRYHLYVSYACPWAHRALIFRVLKGLEDIIDVSVVHPHMLEHGWEFKKEKSATGDKLYNLHYLHELYCMADSQYTGRVTVPVLWDKKEKTIVNNESAIIIRIFNEEFNTLTGNKEDFYPKNLRQDIDKINERVYRTVNNGVYRCGFATTQSAYEAAYKELFETLDFLDNLLSKQQYLVENRLTEADWRLFTTLVRFDVVYYSHFKTNQQRICDYQYLYPYLLKLYHYPGIADTVNIAHIKEHYYFSHKDINPTQIVPVGPKGLFDRK